MCNHCHNFIFCFLIMKDYSEDIMIYVLCSVTQSCPALCDPMDYSPPGSSVLGIFQTRVLERVVISSSRGSSRPKDQTCVSCVSCIWQEDSLPLSHVGSPQSHRHLFINSVLLFWREVK